MGCKYIYVFDDTTKQKLIDAGFDLVVSNTEKSIFVFRNKRQLSFALKNISYVPSNVLTF